MMMTLIEELEAVLNEMKASSKAGVEAVHQVETKLSEQDAFQKALRKGAKIPDFSLPNAVGKPIRIVDAYKEKPIVLVFYRGSWCPFCNLQLRSLQKHLSEIENSPARLVAISMQTPDNSLSTVEKLNLTFDVLSDEGGKVGKLFNLVYTLPPYLNETYKGFGVDIAQYNGKGEIQLYYPATYIINQNGIILKDYISAYMNDRLETKEIIDFLKSM